MPVTYFIDKRNQLFVKAKGKRPLALPGRLGIDKENRLEYFLDDRQKWQKVLGLPARLKFSGKWQLNKNHDLELLFDKNNSLSGTGRFTLRGKIITAGKDNLVFEAVTYRQRTAAHSLRPEFVERLQLLRLSGAWEADANNRLSFLVQKKVLPDVITLKGTWKLNANQQIAYSYEKHDLVRKDRTRQALIFQGQWQIYQSKKIVYLFEPNLNAGFCFRVQFESPTMYPAEKEIRFRLGSGLRRPDSSQDKIISLYGEWKFSKKAGVSFDIDYGQGQIGKMEFNTEVLLDERNKLILGLLNKTGQSLGISLELNHKFLKQNKGEFFLRLKKAGSDSRVEAGINLRF